MDKVIVTALLIIAGVAAAGLVVSTLTPIVGSSSRSVVESQKSVAARIATDVKIIAAHPTDDETITVMVKNIGTENILSLQQSDVYISDTDGSKFIPLEYGVGDDDKWTTDKDSSFVWSRGVTISLGISLKTQSTLVDTHTYMLNFSTPNGVASSYQFTYNAP